MRILFLTESLFPLGPSQSLLVLAQQLACRDFDVHIAALSCTKHELDKWSNGPFSTHALGKTPVTHPFSRNSFQSVYRVQDLIRRLKPDVIHSWCGMAELIGLAANQIRELLGTSRGVYRIATELYIQPVKRLTRQIYENRISHGFHQFVVPHEFLQQHLVEDGYDLDRITVIGNQAIAPSPDLSTGRDFLLSELNLPDNARFVGIVAPLVPKSRLKDLVWACDLLKVIRDDIHLLIIGKGPQLARLRKFAWQTEAYHHCHFVGEHPESERMLAGLDFYWHSHLNEPLPINVMNAMLQRRPTISVYGSGTTEIIRHQQTGFAVNFGARDEFARWTKYLLELPDQANQLAEQGCEFIRRRFDGTTFVDRYIDLYHNAELPARSA